MSQVEGCKLKDYGGDYNVFMEGNEVEAEKMAQKEEAQKEQAKSQIKAKSKVSLLSLLRLLMVPNLRTLLLLLRSRDAS